MFIAETLLATVTGNDLKYNSPTQIRGVQIMDDDLRERLLWFMIIISWLGDEVIEKLPTFLRILAAFHGE